MRFFKPPPVRKSYPTSACTHCFHQSNLNLHYYTLSSFWGSVSVMARVGLVIRDTAKTIEEIASAAEETVLAFQGNIQKHHAS